MESEIPKKFVPPKIKNDLGDINGDNFFDLDLDSSLPLAAKIIYPTKEFKITKMDPMTNPEEDIETSEMNQMN